MKKVVAAVIEERDGKVLVARRRPEAGSGGFWEFPGGKLKKRETPEIGLKREIAEELGAKIEVSELLRSVTYRSSELSIELIAYRANIISGEFKLTDHDEIRWVMPSQMEEADFTEPDRPIVRLLKSKSKNPWKV